MKLKEVLGLILATSAVLAVGVKGFTWSKKNVFPGIEDTHQLRHVNQSSAEALMALMDKVEGDWYIVDEGGAVTDVLMYETSEGETFVFLPNERIFWVYYNANYDDIVERWYYQDFDEHGVHTVIYKR